MIVHRPADRRGHTRLDWLDSRHSFSFNTYHDRAWNGFGPLRVINDDHIAPGRGFDMHAHRDMEILTWILDGRLAHRDSLGHSGEIGRDVVQVMTAGRGIMHSEFNPDAEHPVHLLQIWIRPRETGLEPAYTDRRFDAAGRRDRWAPIASADGREGSVRIAPDATVYACELSPGATVTHGLGEGRIAWVHAARGWPTLNASTPLAGGGAAGLLDEPSVTVENPADAEAAAELLLFDLPRQPPLPEGAE